MHRAVPSAQVVLLAGGSPSTRPRLVGWHALKPERSAHWCDERGQLPQQEPDNSCSAMVHTAEFQAEPSLSKPMRQSPRLPPAPDSHPHPALNNLGVAMNKADPDQHARLRGGARLAKLGGARQSSLRGGFRGVQHGNACNRRREVKLFELINGLSSRTRLESTRWSAIGMREDVGVRGRLASILRHFGVRLRAPSGSDWVGGSRSRLDRVVARWGGSRVGPDGRAPLPSSYFSSPSSFCSLPLHPTSLINSLQQWHPTPRSRLRNRLGQFFSAT